MTPASSAGEPPLARLFAIGYRLLIDCLPWPDPARPWGSPEQEASLRHEIDRLDGQPPLLRTPRMPQTSAA